MTDMEIYVATKEAVVEYLRALPPDALSTRCEYCPAWTLQDVLAHHIHALRTISTGGSIPPTARAAIVEPDPETRDAAVAERNDWTQAGVDERRHASLEDLFAEWSMVVVDMMTEQQAYLVLDLSVHYDDIRETVGGPVARDGVDLRRSLELFHELQEIRLEKAGCSRVALLLDDADRIGDATASAVSGATYDLLRVITSRRTRAEAAQTLRFGALPHRSIDVFPVYGWPEDDGGG